MNKALIALVLLVPAPSVGAYCGMVLFPDSTTGALLFAASKVWLFGLPVVWRVAVEKRRFSLSPARQGGLGAGLGSGLVLSALILAAYAAVGRPLIDREFLVRRLTAVGLGSWGIYAAAAAYWVLVNSVLEEYVWRWFCVEQCAALMRPRLAAVCSAAFFSLHHIVAMQVYLAPAAVALGAAGVFVAGLVWSLMYVRYQSVWPGYLSHAIVDLCVFGLGAWMLFGG